MKKNNEAPLSVKDWIEKGTIESGWYLLEEPTRQTDNAVAFAVEKWNATATKQYTTDCWFPKSQVKKVKNDFYVHGEDQMYLVPVWLIKAKEQDGFIL